jgi:general transcription factor 3C polypeptide 5 (transcription factor C subunit 1)
VGDSLINPKEPLEEPVIGVSLRPRDPLAKKLVSSAIESRNVLVKVTLPKRTGRKRKRGSNDPFTDASEVAVRNGSITAPEFVQRLKDNEGRYTITPVGMINETHRFRNLPDFQMIASDNAMMQELVTHAMKPNYETLKNMSIDNRPGASHIGNFVAPPSFMAANQPYRYEFNQASGVKFEQDASGNVTTTNIQAPPRRAVAPVEPDALEVPQGPPESLKRHHPFGNSLDEAVEAIRKLLDKRPLITRRVAMNYIPQYSDSVFKEATQWVGYSFRAGPWRDSLVKYGVDPRKDPKYRVYQTLMFQLDKRAAGADGSSSSERKVPDGWQSHIFDGENITHSGKTWQICDVTDPLLKSIFDTDAVQEECDVHQFGWYYNGTLCKARAIMRDKMDYLFRGTEPPQAEYEKVANMPDRITRGKLAETYLEDTEVGSKSTALAIEVRSMARLGAKNLENRAKEKRIKAAMEKAASAGETYDGAGEEEDEDADGDASAIDPTLMDVEQGDETMQGDLEADDDEDADADLEAVGNLEDDDAEDEQQEDDE